MKKQLLSLVAVMALGVTAGSAWAETEKIMFDENQMNSNQLGRDVAIDGDLIVAGAYTDNQLFQFGGAVSVFQKDGFGEWNQVKKIIPPDLKAEDYFGGSIDFDGLRIIAGSPLHDAKASNAGAAYIVSWPQNKMQKILADDGVASDQFGYAVSISGDYAIIGAPSKTIKGVLQAGAAYIYERNVNDAWVLKTKLYAPKAVAKDSFGMEVAIKGNRALVNASGVGKAGIVYVYERYKGNWIWASTIMPPSNLPNQYFGWRLDLEADHIVVGASEKAYVYKDTYPGDEVTSAWFLESTLVPSDPTPKAFGSAVAISGNYITVGAAFADVMQKDSAGTVYVYKKTPKDKWNDKWSQYQVLTANVPATQDYLGWGVDIDGCQVAGGAPGDTDPGAVYHFTDIGIPCN